MMTIPEFFQLLEECATRQTTRTKEMTVAEIEEILGHKVKIVKG